MYPLGYRALLPTVIATALSMLCAAGTSQIAPNPSAASTLQHDLQNAINVDPGLLANSLTVTVKGNMVTLTGEVSSAEAKARVGAMMDSLAGSFQVRNDIAVNSALAAVEDSDDNDGGDTANTASSGAQTKGGASPPAQSGVSAQKSQRAGTDAQQSDTVQSDILQKLMLDPVLGLYALTAKVDVDGVVTLDGTVPNKQDRERATALAKSTPGVRKVENALAVNSHVTPVASPTAATPEGQATSNPALPDSAAAGSDPQNRVQAALQSDPSLAGSVSASVKGNQVTLTGTVHSDQIKQRAEIIAQQAAPSLKIRNRIKLKKP